MVCLLNRSCRLGTFGVVGRTIYLPKNAVSGFPPKPTNPTHTHTLTSVHRSTKHVSESGDPEQVTLRRDRCSVRLVGPRWNLESRESRYEKTWRWHGPTNPTTVRRLISSSAYRWSLCNSGMSRGVPQGIRRGSSRQSFNVLGCYKTVQFWGNVLLISPSTPVLAQKENLPRLSLGGQKRRKDGWWLVTENLLSHKEDLQYRYLKVKVLQTHAKPKSEFMYINSYKNIPFQVNFLERFIVTRILPFYDFWPQRTRTTHSEKFG